MRPPLPPVAVGAVRFRVSQVHHRVGQDLQACLLSPDCFEITTREPSAELAACASFFVVSRGKILGGRSLLEFLLAVSSHVQPCAKLRLVLAQRFHEFDLFRKPCG